MTGSAAQGAFNQTLSKAGPKAGKSLQRLSVLFTWLQLPVYVSIKNCGQSKKEKKGINKSINWGFSRLIWENYILKSQKNPPASLTSDY